MNTINLNSIVLHHKSSTFGRVSRIDSMGNLSFATMPYRGVPEQMNTVVEACTYIGETWQDAWLKLAQLGLNDPRVPGYIPPKPPVVVEAGPYTATVEYRAEFVHISCTFLKEYESLVNSFSDPNEALALGRALITACRPSQPPSDHLGWDWNLGEATNNGWLVFNHEMISPLPDTLSMKAGYEMGYALIQVGLLMEMRRGLQQWLGSMELLGLKVG